MKKILSLLAAGALALGLIGCSGDLHDDVFVASTPLYIEGAVTPDNARVQMTVVDDSTQKYEFTYTKEMSSSWGSPEDGVCFKVMKSADGWTDDFGGKNDTKLEVAVGSEIKLFKRGSSEAPTNPGNIQVAGLKAGTKYAINLSLENWGQASEGITLKVTNEGGGSGTVEAEPVPYYFDGMYLVGSVFKTEGNVNAFNFTAENLIYGASVDSKTGVVTYTKDITAIGENGELGINDSTWNNKIAVKGTEVKADGIAVVITGDGEKGNFNVSGLKVDSPYRVTITTTPDKEVSVSIEEIANYTLTFEIKGLEEGMLAWLNGNCWGSSWPCGWALSGWGGVGEGFALTDAAEADSDGVASFSEKWNVTNVAKPGETLSFELKFIASDNDWESTKFDKDNISFDIEDVSAGTYKVSINAEENTVTVTKQ